MAEMSRNERDSDSSGNGGEGSRNSERAKEEPELTGGQPASFPASGSTLSPRAVFPPIRLMVVEGGLRMSRHLFQTLLLQRLGYAGVVRL